MKYKITLFFVFCLSIGIAQNLVINPSFEDFKSCPNLKGEFQENVKNWSTSHFGSTDYFNNCSQNLGEENYVGHQKARTGDAYVGVYTYAPGSYREYIQGELKESLKKDSIYNVSFYVSLSDCSSHAVNKISVLFTDQKLDKNSINFIHLKNLIKAHIKHEFIPLEYKEFFENTQDWIKINLQYEAKGFEKYFSIGNFDINKKLEKKEVWKSQENMFSYYYIDDVSVIALEDQKPEIVAEPLKEEVLNTEPETPIKTNEIYTLKNVLFEFNKAQLLDVSLNELNKLNKHLKENPNLNIEIYGHTDNIGLDKRNKALSEQRAKAVADYLISEGLNLSRIEFFGFGCSKPISDNETEEGRQLNRRVEFKVIKN